MLFRNPLLNPQTEHHAPSHLPHFMSSKELNVLMVQSLLMLSLCVSCVVSLISSPAFMKLPIEVLQIETVPSTVLNFSLTNIFIKRCFGPSIIQLMGIISTILNQ